MRKNPGGEDGGGSGERQCEATEGRGGGALSR